MPPRTFVRKDWERILWPYISLTRLGEEAVDESHAHQPDDDRDVNIDGGSDLGSGDGASIGDLLNFTSV